VVLAGTGVGARRELLIRGGDNLEATPQVGLPRLPISRCRDTDVCRVVMTGVVLVGTGVGARRGLLIRGGDIAKHRFRTDNLRELL